MKYIKKWYILLVVIALLILIFVIQNSAKVNIKFLFSHADISQSFVIFISIISGVIVVSAVSFFREYKLNITIKKQNNLILCMQEENKKLKERLSAKNNIKMETQENQSEDEILNEFKF